MGHCPPCYIKARVILRVCYIRVTPLYSEGWGYRMRTNISMSAHVGLSPQNQPDADPSSFASRIPANLRQEGLPMRKYLRYCLGYYLRLTTISQISFARAPPLESNREPRAPLHFQDPREPARRKA